MAFQSTTNETNQISSFSFILGEYMEEFIDEASGQQPCDDMWVTIKSKIEKENIFFIDDKAFKRMKTI